MRLVATDCGVSKKRNHDLRSLQYPHWNRPCCWGIPSVVSNGGWLPGSEAVARSFLDLVPDDQSVTCRLTVSIRVLQVPPLPELPKRHDDPAFFGPCGLEVVGFDECFQGWFRGMTDGMIGMVKCW